MKDKITKLRKSATLLLLSLLVTTCGMLSRNADDIINDMRDARHAQYVNVGNGLFGLGRLILPNVSQSGLGINSVQVLDLSRCSGHDRDKFRKRIQDLTRNRYYEEIATKQEGYDTRTALVRRDGQYVSEIVLVDASQNNDMMVLILGQINLENLERILKDQNNYFVK